MDAFASILSSEIARKKGMTKIDSAAATTSNTSKYLKRADLEKQRQEEYLASQARLEAERAERAAKKRKIEDEASLAHERSLEKKRRIREEKEKAKQEAEEQEAEERKIKERLAKANNGTTDDVDANNESKPDIENLDEKTLQARLRKLSQPVRLFGESHLQRLKRLHNLLHPSSSYLQNGNSTSHQLSRPASPPPLTGGQLLINPSDVSKDPTLVYRQLLGWFNLVLSEWSKALSERSIEVKESYQGKQATGAMKQAVEYMEPLFRHLKRRDLDEEIFQRVVDLVVEAQARRYVKANDVYLRLSIGNA